MARKSAEMINRLGKKQMWELTHFVKEKFVEADCSDAEFAKLAEAHFQIPVTQHNVASAREILDIPSHAMRHRAPETTWEKIKDLEARVAALEARLGVK